jgi:hypothetical protein
MISFGSRVKHAWNAFVNLDWTMSNVSYGGSVGYSNRPDRTRLSINGERSIISSIYTRIAIDVAKAKFRHVRNDDYDQYVETINSGLNDCFTVEANVDQGPTDFFMDVVMTLFDKGHAALVPVDTSDDPTITGAFDIKTMRVGEVVSWYPEHVRVSVYNSLRGTHENITLPKRTVGIVVNPLYSVMNEPNSTLKRLVRKLNLLDAIDEQSGSGKLDVIIQLPYTVRSETRRQQAEQRRSDIEFQLKNTKYGIAYADATEKITQLNRPVENNLLKTVEYLTEELYGQLGLTKDVMNGVANEDAMIHYTNRTVEPIVRAIIEELRRKFLTKTARSQGQTITYYVDPFAFVSAKDLAEIADKFTRNEILTANDIRPIIGFKPHNDPKANELRNSNMPQPDQGSTGGSEEQDSIVSDLIAGLNSDIDSILQPTGASNDGSD